MLNMMNTAQRYQSVEAGSSLPGVRSVCNGSADQWLAEADSGEACFIVGLRARHTKGQEEAQKGMLILQDIHLVRWSGEAVVEQWWRQSFCDGYPTPLAAKAHALSAVV